MSVNGNETEKVLSRRTLYAGRMCIGRRSWLATVKLLTGTCSLCMLGWAVATSIAES